MEPEAGETAFGAFRRLVRVTATRVLLVWLLLQLLLHQSVLLQQAGVLDHPLEGALRQARWTVLSREIVLVWPEVPGWRQVRPPSLTSLEEWAHSWLATLGAALDVDTWRVIRRSRDPLALGLTATSPEGIAIDLWLQSSPWVLGQADRGAPSLTLRLQAGSGAAWEALTSRLDQWAWPREWPDEPRPQVLVTYRLQGAAHRQEEAVDGLVQALAARPVVPAAGLADGELWLATPRAAPLPAAFHTGGHPGANVRVRWLPGEESGGHARPGEARGSGGAGKAAVLELVLRPHAFSSLGQLLGRMSSPHIQGKSWTG